jgi:hypothetical protein
LLSESTYEGNLLGQGGLSASRTLRLFHLFLGSVRLVYRCRENARFTIYRVLMLFSRFIVFDLWPIIEFHGTWNDYIGTGRSFTLNDRGHLGFLRESPSE